MFCVNGVCVFVCYVTTISIAKHCWSCSRWNHPVFTRIIHTWTSQLTNTSTLQCGASIHISATVISHWGIKQLQSVWIIYSSFKRNRSLSVDWRCLEGSVIFASSGNEKGEPQRVAYNSHVFFMSFLSLATCALTQNTGFDEWCLVRPKEKQCAEYAKSFCLQFRKAQEMTLSRWLLGWIKQCDGFSQR